MNNTSKQLSIVAYYLSMYDMDAVKALGFHNRTEAFSKLSAIFGRENNYLKLRRDEFDVLTSSHRKGWHNRPPLNELVEMTTYFKQFSFSEMTEIAKSIVPENSNSVVHVDYDKNIVPFMSEEQLEHIINYRDDSSTTSIRVGPNTVRVYNKEIIKQLKVLYNHKCQICGKSFSEPYGGEIVEAHHIELFSETQNNNASNIIIVCPNHHRLIHIIRPTLDKEREVVRYKNGYTEHIILNYHL